MNKDKTFFIAALLSFFTLNTHAATSGTIKLEYDELGRIVNVNKPSVGLTEYSYDNAGNRENVTFPAVPNIPQVIVNYEWTNIQSVNIFTGEKTHLITLTWDTDDSKGIETAYSCSGTISPGSTGTISLSGDSGTSKFTSNQNQTLVLNCSSPDTSKQINSYLEVTPCTNC